MTKALMAAVLAMESTVLNDNTINSTKEHSTLGKKYVIDRQPIVPKSEIIVLRIH